MKFKFLEVKKENKELQKEIKEIGQNFSFMKKELVKKGGLEREGNHYGGFLTGLDHEKFILIRQTVGVILEKVNTVLDNQKNISENVKNNFLKLKEICENIKNIDWEPYQSGNLQNNDFTKIETLTNKGGKNEKMSELLFDINAPISNLENSKFQSIFDSKIEPDRYHV